MGSWPCLCHKACLAILNLHFFCHSILQLERKAKLWKFKLRYVFSKRNKAIKTRQKIIINYMRWISIFGYLMTSLKWALVSTKKNQYLHRLCGPHVLAPCIYPMSLSVKVKCQPRNVWYETTKASFTLEPINVR